MDAGGADVLLTGSLGGPNSFSVLSEAGIEIYSGVRGGTVSSSLREYQSGKLSPLKSPNASSHSGMK